MVSECQVLTLDFFWSRKIINYKRNYFVKILKKLYYIVYISVKQLRSLQLGKQRVTSHAAHFYGAFGIIVPRILLLCNHIYACTTNNSFVNAQPVLLSALG